MKAEEGPTIVRETANKISVEWQKITTKCSELTEALSSLKAVLTVSNGAHWQGNE